MREEQESNLINLRGKSNSLSCGAGAGQPSGDGEGEIPTQRELLHSGHYHSPTLMALLSCSVDEPRSPAPCALMNESNGNEPQKGWVAPHDPPVGSGGRTRT